MNHSLSETREGVCGFFFFVTLFAANMSDNKDKNTSRNVLEEVDLKFLIESLIGKMRRVLRAEME